MRTRLLSLALCSPLLISLLGACDSAPEEVEVISRPTPKPQPKPEPKPKAVATTTDTTEEAEPEKPTAAPPAKKMITPRKAVTRVATETKPTGPSLPDSIDRGVKANKGELNYCIEVARRTDPSISGRIDVAIVVTDGRVTSTKVASNTTDSADLGKCLTRKVKRWRFEPGTNQSTVWPFVFR